MITPEIQEIHWYCKTLVGFSTLHVSLRNRSNAIESFTKKSYVIRILYILYSIVK